MSHIFTSETVRNNSQTQDRGKLREIDSHQLLQSSEGQTSLSFDDIRRVGEWFLQQKFNSVLPSTQVLSAQFRGKTFLAKVAFGSQLTEHFPVTVEPIEEHGQLDLRYYIVPIHYEALSNSQYSSYSESLLALASAAALAPQFYFSLQNGLSTDQCSTKKEIVTSVTPDHGSPLVVAFDTFQQSSATLDTISTLSHNPLISIKEAGHLHGQKSSATEQIVRAGSQSKISAGVSVRSVKRSQLPKHVLYFTTRIDHEGLSQVSTLEDSLFQVIQSEQVALIATALGFTAEVIGNSPREKMIEKIFTPQHADLPLVQLRTLQ